LIGAAAMAAAVVVIVVVLAGSSSRPAGTHSVESIFQDDDHLLYAPTPTVVSTLNQLRGLGVDRIRLTILWGAIAPGSASRVRPRGFDARDPAAYGAAWAPYDRVVELARARGLAVDFDISAPGPLWAMAPGAPNAKIATHYRASPRQFGQFVAAVGRRYSGSYIPPKPGTGSQAGAPLPRVDFWTVWNEPNQPGWLAPQWRTVGGMEVMDSPRLYRLYVDAAFAALNATGHTPARDTILIGELAPEGSELSAANAPIPPMPFLRTLYCLDGSYEPLRGQLAVYEHCPVAGDRSSFVAAHPGLFQATGFAHHPYSFFLAPSVRMSDPNFVPLADLDRLESGLDRVFASYGVNRRVPIYLTEYGYETDPPNPYRGVSLDRQALYLDEAQYIAWRDPRVRSLAQFLLYDAAPDLAYPVGSVRYWSTFQTGLRFLDGAPKASLQAYRLPIFVPDPVLKGDDSVLVWGMLRPARNGSLERARIEWRSAHGTFRDLANVLTNDSDGFLSVRVKVPGPGAVRLSWTAPTHEVLHSAAIDVRAG
jgi:hypothetical protein